MTKHRAGATAAKRTGSKKWPTAAYSSNEQRLAEREAVRKAVLAGTPDEFKGDLDARVDYFDVVRAEQERPGKPRKITYLAYLAPTWNFGGDDDEHMVTCNYDDRSATIQDLVRALKRVRRCYCAGCLGEPGHAEGPANLALQVRLVIARANAITTDGHPDNEKRIDALLREAST